MQTNRDNGHRSRDSVIETLANAVFEMASSNASLSKDIQDLIARIDILTGVVVNAQKSRSNTNTIFPITKDNFPNAVVMMIVLALVVLAISLKGCGNQPTFEIADYSSEDSSDDIDTETASIDSDSESIDDTETQALDTDSETETGTAACPWDCNKLTTPNWMTCADFEISDGGVPDSVHNYNHECGENEWCCQPWPPDDTDAGAITELCEDDPLSRCGLTCADTETIDTTKACYHAATTCCRRNGRETDERTEYSPRNDGAILLDDQLQPGIVYPDGTP